MMCAIFLGSFYQLCARCLNVVFVCVITLTARIFYKITLSLMVLNLAFDSHDSSYLNARLIQ